MLFVIYAHKSVTLWSPAWALSLFLQFQERPLPSLKLWTAPDVRLKIFRRLAEFVSLRWR